MKKNNRRPLAVVMGLMLLTGVAMVIAGQTESSDARLTIPTGGPAGLPEGPAERPPWPNFSTMSPVLSRSR